MEVERLAARTVPMHMPGHKRMLRPSDALPYDWDITEIEGADDLHDAHGILAAVSLPRSGRRRPSEVR